MVGGLDQVDRIREVLFHKAVFQRGLRRFVVEQCGLPAAQDSGLGAQRGRPAPAPFIHWETPTSLCHHEKELTSVTDEELYKLF